MTIPMVIEAVQEAPASHTVAFFLGASAGFALSWLWVKRLLERSRKESEERLERYLAEAAAARDASCREFDALYVRNVLAAFRRLTPVREAEHVLGGGDILGGGPERIRAAFRGRLKETARRGGLADPIIVKTLLDAKKLLLDTEERLRAP